MSPHPAKLVPIRSKTCAGEVQLTRSSLRFQCPPSHLNVPTTKPTVEKFKSSISTPKDKPTNSTNVEAEENYDDIKPKITTSLFDPIPLQFTPTPVLPRNFFVTGYSPETLDLETSVTPPSQPALSGASLLRKAAGISENYFPSVENVGPSVAPCIARIVREVARMHPQSKGTAHHRKTIPEVAASHPPYMYDEEPHPIDFKWPPRANPSSTTEPHPIDFKWSPRANPSSTTEPHPTDFKFPPHANPSSSTGLPPKEPKKYKSGMNKQKAHRDPLLHSPVITPPCPILPGENQTPAEQRCYTHKPDLPEYLIPSLGMVFNNFEEAQVYYNRYACHAGFGTKIGQKSGLNRYLYCTHQGKYTSSVSEVDRKREKTTKRCECNGKLRLKEDKYDKTCVIVDMNLEHNHHLVQSPSMLVFLHSHKSFDPSLKKFVKSLQFQNVAHHTIMSILYGNLGGG